MEKRNNARPSEADMSSNGARQKSSSNSLAASSSSSSSALTTDKQPTNRFTKWSSGSKLNKLFNNIERSILDKFSNTSSSDHHQHHQHQRHKQHRQHQNDSSKTSAGVSTKAIITTNSANNKQVPSNSSNNRLQQSLEHSLRSTCQNDTTSTTINKATSTQHHPNQTMDRVTSERMQLTRGSNGGGEETTAASNSQPTPANRSSGKMILNKYQQQIVSAMQTNKNRPAAGKQAATTGSNYSHNGLSIPPPHANDEARNQNHRLLFGCPRTTQPSDHYNSTNDQMASIYDHARNAAIKQNTADQHQPALYYHNSASPASSAQSLPVTKPGMSLAPQSRLRINATDDEESGFCTYQSRRSALNFLPSANRISHDYGKPENNMIQFMRTNQTPLGGGHTSGAVNGLSPQQRQQQLIDQNNMLQSRLIQQQSVNNTQHQLNQVPISQQGIMYNSNLHIQNRANPQQQNANRLSDMRNQTYGSFGHLGPASQAPMQQQYQPQPLYDGQIYANAPPKPRRYQYYDPGFNNPNLMVSPRAVQNHQPLNGTQFTGQQVGGRLFSYNLMGEPAQQVYNQRDGELVNTGPAHMQYRVQRQLPMLPSIPTNLTKSKSSLDVADLTRVKQGRIQADGILRVQPQSSNVPVYGSTRMINQIETSTLQRKPFHNLQITTNYHHQQQQQPHQPPTNLQRSKSIGNLVPDYNAHELDMTQRQLAPFHMDNHLQRQQSIAPVYPKFLTVSSASTNNLNYVGLANNHAGTLLNNTMQSSGQASQISQQITRQDNNNVNDLIQRQHHQQQFLVARNAPFVPMRQNYQRAANGGVGDLCWPNQSQSASTAHNDGDGDATKTNTNTISTSGKFARQSQSSNAQSDGLPPAEGSGFVAQSLDDKIKHLLIGDNSSATIEGNTHPNNKTEPSREVKAWPMQKQSQLQISRQTQSSQKDTDTHAVPACDTPKSFATRQQEREIDTENDERLVREQIHQSDAATSTNMGNRQQRQYQVSSASFAASDQHLRAVQRNVISYHDSMSTNSQLIVDLTTPRVLAKTQTTLLPATSQADPSPRKQQFKPQEAWSMNQLGLPTRYADQSALNFQPDMPKNEHEFQNDASDVVNIAAPYYYSDLKSEEQRRALYNIVQQKSLSPPPQLLSRSIDQSNTRLGPKSATMHASQARMLSETLAASQRRVQSKTVFPDSKSTNNLPGMSSDSSVAKNIDKLFESPVDPLSSQPTSRKLHSVQSMLTLSTNPTGEVPSSVISRVSSDQNQIESLSNSSGYCSDAWKRVGSKSKSLENINQQQTLSSCGSPIGKSTTKENLQQHGNPVYENIRRSDKLLSAINNSTTCLSTSSTRNRKSRGSLPPARPPPTSGSDSMDSILGSSFDDDDENESEENPADIDSDNSTTGIDFIKLSPTTADMSELIEQLKNNHAKLTDEYKSTLTRISKILNRKGSDGKRRIGDKLAGRLQRLEQKSKKCESRSKNQLALIQMMEKAFRQTKHESEKAPASGAVSEPEVVKSPQLAGSPNKILDNSDSADSPQNSISLKQTSLSCVNTSPCHSIDYQNLRPTKLEPVKGKKSFSSKEGPPPPPPPPSPPIFEARDVIKAIVTETTTADTPKKFVAEYCKQAKPFEESATKKTDSVSLSTRHQQVKNQDHSNREGSSPISNSNSSVGQRIQSIESIVKGTGKNPFRDDKPGDISSENRPATNRSSGSKRKNSGAFHELGDDEDDFIEFLSTGTDPASGRSQFESSQFSASDFNNSSSSGSTTESSHSGSVTTDSLDLSSPPAKQQPKGGPAKKSGILRGDFKSSKLDVEAHLKKQPIKSSSSNNNSISSGESARVHKNKNNNNYSGNDDRPKQVDNKFKNVLGNVIDVDVYPVITNPPSSSS